MQWRTAAAWGAATLVAAGLWAGSAAAPASASPTPSPDDGGYSGYVLPEGTGSSSVTYVLPRYVCTAAHTGLALLDVMDFVAGAGDRLDAVGVSIDCQNGKPVTLVDTELAGSGNYPEGRGHDNEVHVGDTVRLSISITAGLSTITLKDLTHPATVTGTGPGGKAYFGGAEVASLQTGAQNIPAPAFVAFSFEDVSFDGKPLGDYKFTAYDLDFGPALEVSVGKIDAGNSFLVTYHTPKGA